jgi:hypothetical protein
MPATAHTASLSSALGESKQADDDPRDEDPKDHHHDPDAPWPVRRGEWWPAVYSQSLLIAFATLFLLALFGHAVAGDREFSSEQQAHGEAAVGVWHYLTMSQFWIESSQNWQRGFLAVGSIVLLSMFLRQRGSAESTPVHASHHTGD